MIIGKWAFSLAEKRTRNPKFATDFEGDKHRIDFKYVRDNYTLENRFKLIPSDTDILITHTPPYGIGDTISPDKLPLFIEDPPGFPWDKERLGSPALRKKIEEVKPIISVFGHIHESYGEWEYGGTKFINAAYLDGDYEPANSPVTFELPEKV